MLQANGIQSKEDAVMFLSNKVDFMTEKGKRDKYGHVIMIKGTIHQEDITFTNM